MWCGVVTLFPEMFKALTAYGVSSRAIANNLLELEFSNPRDFVSDIHKTVDDRPYGGGPGMVMKVAPLLAAITELQGKSLPAKAQVVALSPQGKKVTQGMLKEVVKSNRNIIFVAGRYEGIDERLYEIAIDDEWSIGDYVLSGGELGAMVVIDAMARLIPGVLGNDESAEQDSFSDGLLDHPHYTRPEEIAGLKVPEVLLSGDHERIANWRLQQRKQRTKQKRPDLVE